VNELERALVALGRELDVPEVSDLAPRVMTALAPQPLPAPRRRLVLALALVVLAALLATLAIPDARSALLRFLHIGAARIELVDELPPVSPRSWSNELEFELALGERVSLADARRRAGVELLELDEPPDRVYVGPLGEVWFLYGRPDAVRLLLVQTPRLAVDEEFIIRKLVDAGTRVEPLSVRGRPAYFLSGEPHVVLLRDEYGDVYEAPAWLARDVLVWEERGRTLRMEGALTRDEALALAESLR
jgi:hypothetical protein